MNINCNEVGNVGPTTLINVTLFFTRKKHENCKKVFLFFQFVSVANKTWHLKLVQRESQVGHVFAIYLFQHRVMEA